jgi:hypothetical protein
MSSDSPNPRDAPPSPRNRRSSFADMFSNRSGMSPTATSNGQPPRRLSITTLGLSTLPGAQTSPFSAIRARAESVSSANSNSVDESPFEDDSTGPPPQTGASGSPSSVPQSPFARRMSFGAARVMGGAGGRDARTGNGRKPSGSATGAATSASPPTSTTAKSRGSSCSPAPSDRSVASRRFSVEAVMDTPASLASPIATAPSSAFHLGHSLTIGKTEGFDFAANLKARAERTSVSGPPPVMPTQQGQHQRSKSVVEPPKPEIRKQQKVPDHFQERILKGDFYMD